MANNSFGIFICLILITIIVLFLTNDSLISALNQFKNSNPDFSWIVNGLRNVMSYSAVLILGYFVYKYVHKSDYLDKPGNNALKRLLRKCYEEDDLIDITNISGTNPQKPRTFLQDALLLLFYFVALQVSFLTWGVLQEKIMTQKYTSKGESSSSESEHFTDSQFLVFVNRILAFFMSGMVILCTQQPRHRSPLYKYSFCSISNILSSWCQYEALKYVSFPHQVLSKAAKTIPVMIMGKLISRTKYEYYEYFSAVVLSVGMLFFMLNTEDDNKKGSSITTLSGIILLCSYIAFDSFTSNWQGALFKQYKVSPVQMMCAVNLFSSIFTGVSLLQQGGFVSSFNFMIQFPAFMFDCVLLSICSAAGQLFIFKTISTFGPLVFTIITTIRQGFSVLLSCLIYHHHIYALGIIGVILIFLSIFLRIYCGYRVKAIRKRTQRVSDLKV